MNKRKFLTLTLSALLTSVPLVSCGDDDEDEPNTPDKPNELPQLRSIESYGFALFTFSYNSSGQLTQIKPGSMFADEIEKIDISYNPLKIKIGGIEGEDDTILTDISTNSQGFITSMTCTEEGYSYRMDLSYNSSGNLTKITYNDDGTSTTFTWHGGKLNTVVDDENNHYEYTYTNLANATGAFSPMWEPFGLYWMTGLLGTAPAYFPASITIHEDNEIDQVKLAYKINSNGTIAAEQMTYEDEDETITMTYKYGASKALDETGDPTSAQQIKLPKFKSIFKSHRK